MYDFVPHGVGAVLKGVTHRLFCYPPRSAKWHRLEPLKSLPCRCVDAVDVFRDHTVGAACCGADCGRNAPFLVMKDLT